MALALKYELEAVLNAFVGEVKHNMNEYDYYGIFFEMQKIILCATEAFSKRAEAFWKYELMDRGNGDVRDMIKRCPKCG